MARRYGKRRLGRVGGAARLADGYLNLPDEATPGNWHVVVLSNAGRDHLYTTVTRSGAQLACGPLGPGGYAREHGLTRLVLVETYRCRHTARTRALRLRNWRPAERRRLVTDANPRWADLWDEFAPDLGAGAGTGKPAWDPRLQAGLVG